MSDTDKSKRGVPRPPTEKMRDEDVAHLQAQLALGQKARRAVAGIGLGCLGIGLAVGAILMGSGEQLAGIVFPVLLTPTGALFVWLAARARRTIERDLQGREVAVLDGTVQGKRQMQLPRGKAYSLRVDGRDVFVSAGVFEQLSQGDRLRIRRAPHSGIALSTEWVDADGVTRPLGEPAGEEPPRASD